MKFVSASAWMIQLGHAILETLKRINLAGEFIPCGNGGNAGAARQLGTDESPFAPTGPNRHFFD
ncbi:MAG: hypothetical protein ACOX37_00480 [Bacillota bacterium]